jgi:hypothetical protein
MVEAGGQHIRGFRCGLDYAFIRNVRKTHGCGACYPVNSIGGILVLAPGISLGESMSLYRAGLKLALFLPLGVAMPLSRAPSGFTDVSSVFTHSSRSDATH